MRLRFLAAAAGCALLISPAASAQRPPPGSAAPPASPGEPRTFTTDELAADSAYGFCPLFLSNTFPLDSPQLAERGFSANVIRQQNPRFGEIQMVTARRPDGEVAFGGKAGMVCMVVVTGDKRTAALARLHAAMSWMGLDFKPMPHTGPTLPNVAIHTFRAPVKGQALIVQLMEVSGATPSVIAQLFVTDP
jgi:hypothetical protein